MKSSWFVRSSCAVLVLAIGGCQEQGYNLGPKDDDFELEGDAGRSVDPVVTPEKADAGSTRQDAQVAPATKDAAPDAQPVVDAAAEHDASADASSEHDAGSEPTDAGHEPPAVSFDDVYALITESCVGCHGAGKTLDLSTPELAKDGLVGVEAQYAACVTDGGASPLRVVAGDPAASLLIAKLEGTQSCGKQMPPKALLDAEKIAVFRAWVAAGAP